MTEPSGGYSPTSPSFTADLSVTPAYSPTTAAYSPPGTTASEPVDYTQNGNQDNWNNYNDTGYSDLSTIDGRLYVLENTIARQTEEIMTLQQQKKEIQEWVQSALTRNNPSMESTNTRKRARADDGDISQYASHRSNDDIHPNFNRSNDIGNRRRPNNNRHASDGRPNDHSSTMNRSRDTTYQDNDHNSTMNRSRDTNHRRYDHSPATNNQRRPHMLPSHLSDRAAEKFVETWNRKYACSFHVKSKDCRFDSRSCKRMHEVCESDLLVKELQLIDKAKSLHASKFFTRFCSSAINGNLACRSTVEAMKKHIEDICGISKENQAVKREDDIM
jgi:hypothetical protein